jgi:hypothetical protein
MDGPQSKPPKLGEVTRAVAFVARYGAVFGMAALATAFLYDSIFWWVVDRRVLGYFVLSDHIESAVQVIVLLVILVALSVVLTLAIDGHAYLHGLLRRRYSNFYFAVALVIGWLCVVYGVSRVAAGLPSVWSPEARQIADIVALLAAIIVSPALFRTEVKPFAEGWRKVLEKPLPSVIVLWSIATCIVAIMLGLGIKHPDGLAPPKMTRDVVVIENDAELTGVVIRVLDKGIVLLDMKDRRILFIPKERVRRVDLDVPSADHR